MSNLVIVAIPEDGDPIWKISSEKVPHMTLLFLGDNGDHPELQTIVEFVQHAAGMSLTRFGLDVDRRGKLGEDDADVLFFEDNWELPKLRQFRHHLLANDAIRKAHDSVEQRPEWLPHLTLGYPDTPARETRERIYWVQFDRIAVWTGDYKGPEFELKGRYHDVASEVAMSETADQGAEFLSHYGVKGMKWGVRKSDSPTEVAVRTNQARFTGKTQVKAEGGTKQPASKDAVKVAGQKQKLKKSGAAALSNDELRDIIARSQLETQAQAVVASRGKKFLTRQAESGRDRQTQEFINEVLTPRRRKVSSRI